ncbi:MAG: NUDIX domain-containing protein [Oscillospiraceae bacterium]|jgi:8-oxo-dGTP pyrophosphatase MutT (NUDIX family)|nr:NUDIX domain-containing protein [Oscillospiraceae bacterium]
MAEREIWDAYDENGELLGVELYRGEPIPDGMYHIVVEVVTFTTDGEVLVTQRDPDKVFPLKWEITGGSKLKGESPIQGALRELAEETGITAREGDLRLVYILRGERWFYHCYAIIVDRVETVIKLQQGETVDYRWLPYEEFKRFVQSDDYAPPLRDRFNAHVELFDAVARDAAGQTAHDIHADQKITLETAHFLFTYPPDETVAAREIVSVLEANYARIAANLSHAPDFKPTIILHADVPTFHRTIGRDDAPDWVCGTTNETEIQLALHCDNDILSVAVHELTHIISDGINSRVPVFLAEGIAAFEAGQNQVDAVYNLGEYPTAAELFAAEYDGDYLYEFAYSFVRFVVETEGYARVIALLKTDYESPEFDIGDIERLCDAWLATLRDRT